MVANAQGNSDLLVGEALRRHLEDFEFASGQIWNASCGPRAAPQYAEGCAFYPHEPHVWRRPSRFVACSSASNLELPPGLRDRCPRRSQNSSGQLLWELVLVFPWRAACSSRPFRACVGPAERGPSPSPSTSRGLLRQRRQSPRPPARAVSPTYWQVQHEPLDDHQR